VKRRWKWIILLIILADGLAGGWWYYWQRDRSQDAVILAAAQRYGVDPALVKAVVWRESWFNPGARGKKEEIGLMQLRAAAAGEWAARCVSPRPSFDRLRTRREREIVRTLPLEPDFGYI